MKKTRNSKATLRNPKPRVNYWTRQYQGYCNKIML